MAAITGVEIKGLRGIARGRLDGFTNLVVIVGPNGSGKSTLLDALRIASSPDTTTALWHCVQRRAVLERTARWLFNRGGHGQAEIRVSTSKSHSRVVRLVRPQGNEHSVSVDVQVSDLAGTSETRLGHLGVRFDPGGGGSHPTVNLPLSKVAEVRFIEYEASSAAPLHALFTRVVEAGLRDRFVALIRTLLPRLKNIEILTDFDKPVVYLVYEEMAIPVAMSGDGIHWLVRLACEIVSREHAVVLLEEPETHLHPGAMRQAAQVFRTAAAQGTQLFLTTHSLELIDAITDGASEAELKELSLHRVQLENGELKSSRLNGEDVAVARFEIASDLR